MRRAPRAYGNRRKRKKKQGDPPNKRAPERHGKKAEKKPNPKTPLLHSPSHVWEECCVALAQSPKLGAATSTPLRAVSPMGDFVSSLNHYSEEMEVVMGEGDEGEDDTPDTHHSPCRYMIVGSRREERAAHR